MRIGRKKRKAPAHVAEGWSELLNVWVVDRVFREATSSGFDVGLRGSGSRYWLNEGHPKYGQRPNTEVVLWHKMNDLRQELTKMP